MDHTATNPVPQQSGAPRARSPYAITYALIAINVLVFAAMVASGVSFTQPTPLDVVNWGGDYTSPWLRLGHLHVQSLCTNMPSTSDRNHLLRN